MAVKTKYKDLLDYTVSYKAVWTVFGVLFAFGVAGAIAYTRLKPKSEDEKARQEVKSAERLLQRADACAQQDLKAEDQAMLADGRAALAAAQSALVRRAFGEASASAHDAQESLKQFAEHVCATRDAVAEFIKIQGDVKVKKVQSPRWVPARKGSLAVGDRVWSIDGVAQIAYKLSSEIQDIRPGTIIEIKDVFRKDGKDGTETRLEQGEMRMRSAVDSVSRILAPHDTSIEPRGDEVEIDSAAGSTSTHVAGRRGGALVKHGTATARLERNQRVEARSDGTFGNPVKALESPELKDPIDGRIFTTEKPEDKIILFKWMPDKDAQGYLFDLARNDVFAPNLTAGENQRVASFSVDLDLPPPNTYYWRVAGIDKEGVRGAWSEVRRFAVRGSLPAGTGPPPPKIVLGKPIEFGDRVIISGHTDQYVTLEVVLNGVKYRDVTPDDKGDFQVHVPLSQDGRNVIEFVAHDTYGQVTKEQVIAFFTL